MHRIIAIACVIACGGCAPCLDPFQLAQIFNSGQVNIVVRNESSAVAQIGMRVDGSDMQITAAVGSSVSPSVPACPNEVVLAEVLLIGQSESTDSPIIAGPLRLGENYCCGDTIVIVVGDQQVLVSTEAR